MTGKLFLDIETANVQGDQREVARPFMKVPTAVLKLTQAESKAANLAYMSYEQALAVKYTDAQDVALDQTALNGLWGEVIAVAWAWNNDNVHSLMRVEVPDEDTFLSTLADFIGSKLKSLHTEKPTIIGHNIQFDTRFLWQRYIVNGLTPPHWLTRALNAKPWDTDKVFDTMTQWAGLREYVGLQALCAGLGIDVPKTLDGSEVPQAWLDGRYEDIRAHVLADVEAVRAVHRRMSVTL